MDFSLTKEQEMIRSTAQKFAENEIAPVINRFEEEHKFPAEIVRKMAELGFMGMNIKEEYGGFPVGTVSYSLALTEIAKASASVAVTMSVTNMVAEVIQEFAKEEIKKRYLPPLCSGEYLAGAFCLTEPNAGSDAGAIQTRAEKVDGGYIINGSKIFITSAEIAGVFVVWAVTDKSKGKKGISAFLVPAGTKGLVVGKKEEKMGQCASPTNEVALVDCFVPENHLLGIEGDGYKIALMELAGGRIGIASLSLGVGYAAIDYAKNFAKERIQFGKPIAEQQAIQFMLADCYTELDAARMLVLRAAFLKEKGLPYTKEGSMAKLYASEVANKVCIKAVQILGGYGYSKEYPVERYLRDIKVTTIYEGTSEVQRMVIAKEIIK